MSLSIPVSDLFNAANANIVLRSAYIDSSASALKRTEIPTDFRLQKEQLRRVSPAFREMLDTGDRGDAHECPTVHVDEGAVVIEEILRLSARNDIEAYSRLKAQDPRLLLLIWKASAKYKIADLQFITEVFLQERVHGMGARLCSVVYVQAVNHQRPQLRAAAASRLALLPSKTWLRAMFHPIDTNGIMLEMIKAREGICCRDDRSRLESPDESTEWEIDPGDTWVRLLPTDHTSER